MLRRLVFALCIVVAASFVVTGVALVSVAAGFIVAGLLLAGVSWLLLAELDGPDFAALAPAAEPGPVEVPAYPVPTAVDDAA